MLSYFDIILFYMIFVLTFLFCHTW